MSSLVELSPEEYDETAFSQFDPAAAGFAVGNARAMMWFSQLAYETGQHETIKIVGSLWSFANVMPFTKSKIGFKASFNTCGIIGERADAVVIAFGGTDPAVWQTLATDLNIRPTKDKNTHFGFQAAIDAVAKEVDHAVEMSRMSGRPLFVAGHSLGGALAALAAQHSDTKGVKPKAIYTFGMPRVGGEKFRTEYDAKLGSTTYRLVHGVDVVARIPMSSLGFRHVGRSLQCKSGEKFDPAAALSDLGSDQPAFAQGIADTLVNGIGNVLAGKIFSPVGPGPFGPLFKFLPPSIRDHLQDRYYIALTPKVESDK
jgi:triacylglycerol lipase